MFNWLKTKFQDMRIAMSSPAFEAAARSAHIATAVHRYCTLDIEREITRLMETPRQEMQNRYLGPIKQLRSTISRLRAERAAHRENIRLLDRSYKSELDPLYAELTEPRDRIKTLLSEKSAAHDDMAQARADIDSWYSSSSGTFFGNGGKKLPSHSLFGQSFGDLDGYKEDRDTAYCEIEHCGNEIGAAKARTDQLRKEIASIKADRQRMYELRKQGLSSAPLKRTAHDIEKRIWQFEYELSKKDVEMAAFREAARHRTGVVVLEQDIEKVIAKREEFIRTFDQACARTERQLLHRGAWLRDHAG